MALQTDLSRSPYFDDYDVNKNFYKVLYRPGVALQTRELNQMQTIMQDQIDKFGRFVFKEGSVVEGCSFTFDNDYRYIKINDNFANGTAFTISDFVGRYVTNDNGLRALIVNTEFGYQSQDPDLNTLYIKYLGGESDVVTFANGDPQTAFANNENLQIKTSGGVAVGNVTVATVANSAGIGYAFTTTTGVIFKKGYFIRVEPQTVVVSKYTNQPDNLSVGFEAVESIVTPEADSSLYDNAAGSPNYSAPGAHRLKLTPTLQIRETSNTSNTTAFFSLCDFKSGKPVSIKNDPQLATLGKDLARRTYETNGNYIVYPFILTTEPKASDDVKAANNINLSASRGIGYVEGYRVEFVNNNKIDLRKGLDSETYTGQVVSTNYGNYVRVKEYCGQFNIGNAITQVELHSVAKTALSGSTFLGTTFSGSTKIGTAFIRGFSYDSGASGTPDAVYRLYLFNISINPGKNFSSVRSIIASDGTSTPVGVADTLQSYNSSGVLSTVLEQPIYSNMIFPVGKKALTANGFAASQYVYRTIANSGTFSNTGGTGVWSANTPAMEGVGSQVINNQGSRISGASTSSFLLVPTQTGYSSKAGTVAVTTTTANVGSSNVVGTGTSFLTNYLPGDYITINSVTRCINVISNNTFLTVTSPYANTFSATAANTAKKAFPAGVPIDFSKNSGSIDRFINASSTSLTFSLGELVDSAFNAVAYYDILRSGSVPISKQITKHAMVTINCASHSANTVGPFSLGLPDVVKINAIYINSGTAANSGTDYKSSFAFDNGQRDGYYDLASITPKGNILTSDSRIVVDFDVFSYTYTSGKGYFTANSYPLTMGTANSTTITIQEIPQFIAQDGSIFDLRDSIDFRPFATNTAVVTTTLGSTTTNPSSAVTLKITGLSSYIPTPDENFQTTLSVYKGRKDRAIIRTDGSFAVLEGEPSFRPTLPPEEAGSMTLGVVDVPPYPTLSSIEAKTYNRYDYQVTTTITQNKRYTMKDINVLSNKIDNLEYYTSLSLLEKATKDTLVRSGTTGQNRFQNGIMVDSFADKMVSDQNDPNINSAIDPIKTELRPYFLRFQRPLSLDINQSSNIVQKPNKSVWLAHTDVPYITQSYASKYRNCIEGNIYTYRGEIRFDPPGATMPDMQKSPDVTVAIDLASDWVNLGASAFGSQWGAWNSTSSTVNESGPKELKSDVTDAYGNEIQTYQQKTTSTTSTTNKRSGMQMDVTTSTKNYNLGEKVTDVQILPYVKSQSVTVLAHGLKPYTRVYVFMNDVDVTNWFKPWYTPVEFQSVLDTDGVAIGSGSGVPSNTKVAAGYTKLGKFADAIYTNRFGSVYGEFQIPPNTFKATTLEMTIVDVPNMVTGKDAITTQAKGTFYGSNLSIFKGETILAAREATLSVKEVTQYANTITVTNSVSTSIVTIPAPAPEPSTGGWDGGTGCCFDPNANVLMENQSWKKIKDVEVGDRVLDNDGNVNNVTGLKSTIVGDRKMIKIKGYDFFATDDHLFLTNNGWKTWRPDRLIDNNRDNAVFLESENRHHPIDNDDILITSSGNIPYADLEVEEVDFDPNYVVHDLHLDGSSIYIVDGFVVHNCGGGGGCGDGTGGSSGGTGGGTGGE